VVDSTTRQDAVRAYVRFTLGYVRDLNARGGEDQWERLAVGPVQLQGDNVIGFLGLQSTTHAERQALATFVYDAVDRSWNPKPTNVKQIRVAAKLKVPDVLKRAVVSSNVGNVSYYPGKKVLQVGFKGGGAYQYFDVPRETYDDFITAGSKGKFFWQHVRNKGYSYRKVEAMVREFRLER